MRASAWFVAVAVVALPTACRSDPAATYLAPPTASDNPSTAPEAVDLPSRIVCGTQYRPNAESMDGAEEANLVVERDDGGAGIGPGASLDFATMSISGTYVGDAPDGRVVRIAVTTSDSEPLMSVLYQLGDIRLSDVEFAGGHGFTGLHYVQHGLANLQFWCTAE